MTTDAKRWSKAPVDKAPKTLGIGASHRRVARSLEEVHSLWSETHPRWGSRSRCGPGLATGHVPGWPTALVALDVDDDVAWRAWLGARTLPPSLTWSSGRRDRVSRTHLYSLGEGVELRSKTRVLPGLDVRAGSGHVVLPGAWHWTGSMYRVTLLAPVAPLPNLILQELLQAERTASKSRPPAASLAEGAPATAPPPPPETSPRAWQVGYANALRIFRRACGGASTQVGRRRNAVLALTWEGLQRGLARHDVEAAVREKYLARASREASELQQGLRQLQEALAKPPSAGLRPADHRFSVEAQVRYALEKGWAA